MFRATPSLVYLLAGLVPGQFCCLGYAFISGIIILEMCLYLSVYSLFQEENEQQTKEPGKVKLYNSVGR